MSQHKFFGRGLSRREFIQSAAVAVAATAVCGSTSHAEDADPSPLIDSQPVPRRVAFSTCDSRVTGVSQEPRDKGVTQAWAGSLDLRFSIRTSPASMSD